MQFIDLGAQRARLGDRISTAIERVVADGRYIFGPDVAKFEQQIADYIGVKHAIACANGTDALLIPLLAAGVGAGDAVFCPGFTFAATAEVIVLAGAEPVFVDVDPDTYNIVPEHLQAAVDMVRAEGRLNPRAVIPVDLFGLAANYDAVRAIATAEDLFVLEDAAQSIGGTARGGKCGALGDAAGTSFYPAKPLGCYGDGGAMFTDDDGLAEILRSVGDHGKGESQYDNVRLGFNSRLDTLQAAILIEKLAILEEEMAARQVVAKRYIDGLGDMVKVPVIDNANRSAFAQFAIETPVRDGLKAHLQEQGIPSAIYYIKPLHQQPAFGAYASAPTGMAVSESLPDRILCLPMHPYLGQDDQDRIIDSIRGFVGQAQTVAAE